MTETLPDIYEFLKFDKSDKDNSYGQLTGHVDVFICDTQYRDFRPAHFCKVFCVGRLNILVARHGNVECFC